MKTYRELKSASSFCAYAQKYIYIYIHIPAFFEHVFSLASFVQAHLQKDPILVYGKHLLTEAGWDTSHSFL